MTLKQARAGKNFNQHDLALLTNINQTKISLMERGYVRPSKEELLAIGKALNVSPSELVFVERRAWLNQVVCETRSQKRYRNAGME